MEFVIPGHFESDLSINVVLKYNSGGKCARGSPKADFVERGLIAPQLNF
jgi:hypothetical protein